MVFFLVQCFLIGQPIAILCFHQPSGQRPGVTLTAMDHRQAVGSTLDISDLPDLCGPWAICGGLIIAFQATEKMYI